VIRDLSTLDTVKDAKLLDRAEKMPAEVAKHILGKANKYAAAGLTTVTAEVSEAPWLIARAAAVTAHIQAQLKNTGLPFEAYLTSGTDTARVWPKA
jgi:hypothetical protein